MPVEHDELEDEAVWIKKRVVRLHGLLPTFSDERVVTLLKDLIAGAEQRLDALARRSRKP